MKKNKLPSLISMLILTLITSVFWVSLTTYRAFTIKQAESVPSEISDPINLNLNQAAIKTIESRIFLDNSQIPEQILVSSSPVPSQTNQTPSPAPTLSATPTPVPSPTPTGL